MMGLGVGSEMGLEKERGVDGMGDGGQGVRMVEWREALSCAIDSKWNLRPSALRTKIMRV